MDFPKLLIVVAVLIVGYIPYKTKQRKKIVHLPWKYAVSMTVWFGMWTFLLIRLIGDNLSVLFTSTSISVFIVSTIMWLVSPFIVRILGKPPIHYFTKFPTHVLIRFESSLFLVKYVEVLFQQSLFLYILTRVLNQFLFIERIIWFTILISILHLGNVFFLDKRRTLLFFILSIPMAIGFGWLILEGFVLITVSLHLLFYLLYYGRFWFTTNNYETVLSR